MSRPSISETYAKLMEHLRLAQEDAAMLMFLNNEDGTGPGKVIAKGWFHISEALKKMIHAVTQLAMGKLH